MSFFMWSIFLSFSPIDFMFTGWIGYDNQFFEYLEILIVNPQTNCFHKVWYIWKPPTKVTIEGIFELQMKKTLDMMVVEGWLIVR